MRFFLLSLFFLFLAAPAHATTYFVSNIGDGTLPQLPDEATCWGHIGFDHATLSPGDTVYFLGTITGKYLSVPSSGNADTVEGRIFIRGDYPGNPGIIDSNGLTNQALRLGGHDYITVKNISIVGAIGDGLANGSGVSDYLNIEGCEFYGSNKGAVTSGDNIKIFDSNFRDNVYGGLGATSCDNLHVYNCKFYQNGTPEGGNNDGLFVGDGSENFLIENCEAFDNYSSDGSGMDTSGVDEPAEETSGEFRNCKSYNNFSRGFSYSLQTLDDHVTYSNCIAWGNYSNLVLYSVGVVNLYGCVFGDARMNNLHIGFDSSSLLAITLKNNIFFGDYPVTVRYHDGAIHSMVSEYNCWKNGSATFGNVNSSTNVDFNHWNASGYDLTGSTIDINPLFHDEINNEYFLQEDSPCIDTGVVTPTAHDFNGYRRPIGAAPDKGAYEYGRILPSYGSTHQSVSTVTANTVLKPSEAGLVTIDSTEGNVAVYLPPLKFSRGLRFCLHRNNGGANTVTVYANEDGGTISDAVSKVLTAQHDTLIMWGGANQWYEQQ